MGANCVLGYVQMFDLEGERGIVVRGCGTAANIYKKTAGLNPSISPPHHEKGDKNLRATKSNNPQLQNITNTNMNIHDIQSKFNKLSPSRMIHMGRIHSESDLSELNMLIHNNPGGELVVGRLVKLSW